MKPVTVILSAMVTLSLAFSIAAFALVAQNNGFFTPSSPSMSPPPTGILPTNKPTATVTETPTINPTPPTPSTAIAIKYSESSRQEITENTTRVTLAITAIYQNGSEIKVNYSDFYLQLSVSRWVLGFTYGTVLPLNYGTFTLGSSHPAETIQLTFEFPTRGSNGMDMVPTSIALKYNGPATVSSIDITS